MLEELTAIERQFNELEDEDGWDEFFKGLNLSADLKISPFTAAKHPSNEKYNRYRNILPYDHSRVKLNDAGDTDYINANYVQCGPVERKYILTQGPLKNTCEHFWQMVWEHNTKGIIMLNRLLEKGVPKCEMYFPNADEDDCEMTLEFGKFRLNYLSEQPYEDYSVRLIECENVQQKETREIYHFHFNNWPDFGEPEHTTSFLKFLDECKRRNVFDTSVYGPPIVHCSAGVGRSGTFVLADSMLEMYKRFGTKTPTDPETLLTEIRNDRMGLVQAPTQLRFAYQAIIDGINAMRSDRISSTDGVAENATAPFTSHTIKQRAQKKMQSKIEDDDDDDDEEADFDYDDDFDDDSSSDDEDDDDEDDDDDEYDEGEREEQNGIKTEAKDDGSQQRRPDTGLKQQRPSNKFRTTHTQKHRIERLRRVQQQNKPSEVESEAESSAIVDRSELTTARPSKPSSVAARLSDDDSSSTSCQDDDQHEEEQPMARSALQTAVVNKPRKPLEVGELQTTDSAMSEENTDPLLRQRKLVDAASTVSSASASTSTKQIATKILSDKEKRVAEQVKAIKLKQLKHEQSKHFYERLKPLIITGSCIALGGLIVFQMYKKFM